MITADRQEILRYLGYRREQLPDAEVEQSISLCLEELSAGAEPRSVRRRFPVVRTEGKLTVAGIGFESRSLEKHLAGCSEAVLFAATLGMGVERYLGGRSAFRRTVSSRAPRSGICGMFSSCRPVRQP